MKPLLRWLLIPLIGFAIANAAPLASSPESLRPTTVFVLRHAEADDSDPTNRNPGLSEAGVRRSQALARLLPASGITHTFCSEYRRTHDTLMPLAEKIEQELVEISARTPKAQIKALRALPPGSVAVVAGHSNTAPGLVEALGVEVSGVERHPQHGPMLGHDEYDRLFVVTISPSADVASALVELRYGN